jgi:SAM-dependent methyltransferase
VPPSASIQVFRSLQYQRHNIRRQEHLASLGLDLHDRTVLEVGAGVGDHTTFFLDRGCTVLSTEARPENCELFTATMKQWLAESYDKVLRCGLYQGDVETLSTAIKDSFDIVYCYGLLYHVEDPAAVLAVLAQHCRDLFLLETCVSYGNHESINPVSEPQTTPSQSFHGQGCRPTRPWIFNRLKTLFPEVYVPRTQPAHEEFPLDWTGPAPEGRYTRAVFIGSRRPLANPLLLDTLPDKQSRC